MGRNNSKSSSESSGHVGGTRPGQTRQNQRTKKVVYYESMKRKVKIKRIYECRCNGKLQTKRFTRLTTHWVGRGTGTPKDKKDSSGREGEDHGRGGGGGVYVVSKCEGVG